MSGKARQIAATRQHLALVTLIAALLWVGVECASGAEDGGSSTAAGSAATAQDSAPAEVDILAPVRAALADGRPQEALELAEGARRAGADRVQVLLLKAEIFAQMQRVDDQRAMLLAAVATDDSLCLPRLILAGIEERRGLWQQAERYYKQAIAANSSCRNAYLQLARLYEHYDQPMRALRTLQQAVENNLEDIALLQALGEAFKQRGMLQAAESVYGRILTQGDNQAQAQAYRHLGDIYREVGQYKDAFDCYVKAEKLLDSSEVVAEEGYTKIFAAADDAVAAALSVGWQLFDAFVGAGPVAREDAYLTLEESLGKAEQIRQFLEQVQPPQSVQEAHSQRELFYTVACEALVTAQVYLDTGNASLLTAARERRAQADHERQRLPKAGAGDESVRAEDAD